MSKTQDVDLPAFPQPDMSGPGACGMTLRDYFAAQALAAIKVEPQQNDIRAAHEYAKAAYLIADAMLAERAKR